MVVDLMRNTCMYRNNRPLIHKDTSDYVILKNKMNKIK